MDSKENKSDVFFIEDGFKHILQKYTVPSKILEINHKYYYDLANKIFVALNGRINPIVICPQFYISTYDADELGCCTAFGIQINMNSIYEAALHYCAIYCENSKIEMDKYIQKEFIKVYLLDTIAHELAHYNQYGTFKEYWPSQKNYHTFIEPDCYIYSRNWVYSNLPFIELMTETSFDLMKNQSLFNPHLQDTYSYRMISQEEFLAQFLTELSMSDNYELYNGLLQTIVSNSNVFIRYYFMGRNKNKDYENYSVKRDGYVYKDVLDGFVNDVMEDILGNNESSIYSLSKSIEIAINYTQFHEEGIDSVNSVLLIINGELTDRYPIVFDSDY